MAIPPFRLLRPGVRRTCVVFSSPHSGRSYPADLMQRTVLDQFSIRSSEDAFVDQLFDGAPGAGAPLLLATAPRAYVDLNRASDEMDPALIDGLRRNTHNPRIASGLGVVPRVVAGGRAIYRGKLTASEARARVRDVWRPFHDQLQTLLDDAQKEFGRAILIDCHSMPHEAIDGLYSAGNRRPDVVLGDRFGAAAAPEVMDRVEAAFVAVGLCVARNAPFAGAYITQNYGCPAKGRHVVQIEIDRALYMDERTISPHAGFDDFKRLIDGVVAEIADLGRPEMPMAAE